VIFSDFNRNLSLYEMSHNCHYLNYRNNSDMLNVSERIGAFPQLRYIAETRLFAFRPAILDIINFFSPLKKIALLELF